MRDSRMTCPGWAECSRGPASVKAALRAPRSRSKSLDTGLCASAYIQLSGGCQTSNSKNQTPPTQTVGYARHFRNLNDTRRRESAMSMPRRQPENLSPPPSSDTARPVDGYAAPQLHTHAVIFNMTERENGLENGKQMRALQPHEMFVSQRYVTALYRSELACVWERWAMN